MVLYISLLNTQHYKVRIKGVVAIVTLDYGWSTYKYIYISFSCLNFLDEAWWFLSLRVFELLSSSLLLFLRYVLRPSSGVCRTREPSWNFELRPLLNPRGTPVLIPGTSVKYFCLVARLLSGLNLQPPNEWVFGT